MKRRLRATCVNATLFLAPTSALCLGAICLGALGLGFASAQEYRPRTKAKSKSEFAQNEFDMMSAEAPRAGSIDRQGEGPAYQQPMFDPPPAEPVAPRNARATRRSVRPTKQRAADYTEDRGEYFDARAESGPARRRRATVNRTAFQDTSAADPMTGGGGLGSVVSPEDLPMPGTIEAVPSMSHPPYGAMPMHEQDFDGQFHPGGCSDGSCGACDVCNACDPCDSCPDWYPGKDLTLSAGVHGFKNSVDAGQNSNFGFQEAVNWSSPFWNAAGIGFQLGFQAVQSDFHESAFFTDDRSQYFLTTGLFRRQLCDRGWQWGVVYDQLFDEFADEFDVSQVRGELSYLFRGHELGVWFASNVGDDQPGEESTSGVLSYETVDLYAFFYRRRLMHGGEGRLWGGFTGDSDTIFGGDLRVPLACDWDVVAAFNYLAPQDDQTADGQFAEAWNLGINLVWYVCPEGAFKAGGSRYRPLFNVADNGTLITNTVRQ